MAALMTLGLTACAAEPPPPPPPSSTERASTQTRRRPVMRARNGVPATPAPRPQEEAPVVTAPRPPEETARPPEQSAAETRQERDRRAFVVCRERGSAIGPGVETVSACLRTYSSTGVVPGD